MKIETNRLTLIPCTRSTMKLVEEQNYDNGPQITTYLNTLDADASQLNWGVWFVIRKEDGVVIGDIGFKGKPDEEKTVEIGYGILPEAQKQGFATEAVKGLMNWAYSSGEVERILADCYVGNEPSIKVLEKLGMKKVVTREGMIYWEASHSLWNLENNGKATS